MATRAGGVVSDAIPTRITAAMLRDANGQVYLDFGVSGVPEGYFLSPGLEVESRFVGELRENDFRELLGRIGDAS